MIGGFRRKAIFMTEALLTTNLSLPGKRSGKVRDLYDVTLLDGSDGLLIIATDRISAFDVVMQNGLPGKGIVLTQISRFWFDRFAKSVQHHLVSTDAADIPGLSAVARKQLEGRVMLCRKARVLPIECIARGYLAGSGYKDYLATGAVCGIPLPQGLRNGDQLPAPIFTPSTKAESGHDENISFEEGAAVVGERLMQWLKERTLALYKDAADYARTKGIILADTKFEFGLPLADDVDESLPLSAAVGDPMLIDEIFTPDSSRFWPLDRWQPGQEQESFDKQGVRNYLEGLVGTGQWNKQPPGPALPLEVVAATIGRYCEAFERLTGAAINLG